MPKRRLLFVVDSLNIGGAEKSITTLLPLLPADKFDIDLLLTARGGKLEGLVPPHVTIRKLPVHSPGPAGRMAYTIRRALMSLSCRLLPDRARKADFFWRLFGGGIPMHPETYDVAIAWHQGLPTFYVDSKVQARRKLAWINAEVHSSASTLALLGSVYGRYDTVVAVSEILRRQILSRMPGLSDKMAVINDIVNIDSIMTMAGETSPYPAGSPLVLLTVGRLEPVKGQDIAIEACRLLRERDIPFHWYFVGDGSLHSTLSRMIREYGLTESVTLCGATANPYPYMKYCDIYIQPSRHEGYGIALYEARVFRRPLIITDFPVARTHISPETGIICPTTPDGIADAVTSLCATGSREWFYRSSASTSEEHNRESLESVINHFL